MPFRLVAMVLGASLTFAAQKFDTRHTDPRIGVRNVTYAKGAVQFDLVDKASAPIVVWGVYCDDTDGGARGTTRVDLIEPGEARHGVMRNCKLHDFSAVFADGTWAGDWSELGGMVKEMTVQRLVAERWLVTLRALPTAPDPVDSVGRLLEQLPPRSPGPSYHGFSPRLPEEYLRQVIDFEARFDLRLYVVRCYHEFLMPDTDLRAGPDPKGDPKAEARDKLLRDRALYSGVQPKRDLKAEAQLKTRSDADEQIRAVLAREAAAVQREFEGLAWVTMFGPNGERIGPAIPPPPPHPPEPKSEGELATRPED
jgi:hypothetical protein